MEKFKGFNRNLMGGKRPHRKIQRLGKCNDLAERVLIEAKGLSEYQLRVGQITKLKHEKFLKFFNERMKEMKQKYLINVY